MVFILTLKTQQNQYLILNCIHNTIMALLHKNLSKQVDYHHQIGAYEQSRVTKNIEKQALKKIRLDRIRPKSLVSTKNAIKVTYNKWYINPQLQYKPQSTNPKNDKRMLNNQQYVYNNLRNPQFWNWMHPFETGKLPALKTPNNLDKIDPKILQGFKKFIDQSPNGKRLPSIVQHILLQKNNRNSQEKQKNQQKV